MRALLGKLEWTEKKVDIDEWKKCVHMEIISALLNFPQVRESQFFFKQGSEDTESSYSL